MTVRLTTIVSPGKAIRAKCLDCCGGVAREVDRCRVVKCALHPFRLGKNPFRKPRQITDAQREALSGRLRAHQERRNSSGLDNC